MTDSVARIFALSAIEAGQTDKSITVSEKIGGIEAGKVYPEGTSLSEIISDMLSGGTPSEKVTIYYGATDEKPTDLSSELISIEVSSDVLLSDEGYTRHITSGNVDTKTGQYPVFAIPNTYSLTKWYVPGFEVDIPHSKIEKKNYNIYYLDDVSYDEDIGGIDYIFKIKGA